MQNNVAAPTTPSPAKADGDWSAPVDGVRARLVATTMPADPSGKPQVRVDLEIENVSDVGNPIEIWWDSFDATLKMSLDADGAPAKKPGIGGSFASPPPYWLQLPVDSAIRFTVTKNAFEYVPSGMTLFRPTTFQAWEVTGAKALMLGATLTAAPNAPTSPTEHHRAWTGTLQVPKIAIPR